MHKSNVTCNVLRESVGRETPEKCIEALAKAEQLAYKLSEIADLSAPAARFAPFDWLNTHIGLLVNIGDSQSK